MMVLLSSVSASALSLGGVDPVDPSGDFAGLPVVFLLAGQSNMIGRFGPIDGVLDATDADILMYQENIDSLVTAADPLDHFGENADNIGLGLSFAKDFKASSSPSKVILVGAGLGGAGFLNGDWVEVSGSNHYADVAARWEAAWTEILSVYPTAVVGGVLWLQGEDEVIDYNSSISNGYDYSCMAMNLFRNFRDNFSGFTDDTNFVVGALPPGTALTGQSSYAGVQTAISEIPNSLNKTAFAAGADLSLADDRHYDAVSLRTIGSRYAAALLVANDSVVAIPAPTFTEDASNVETMFAFDVSGADDYDPLVFAAGTNRIMENKRVYIESGVMVFDGDAELRFGGDGGTPILLGSRDFLFKTSIQFDSTSLARGVFSLYQTAGNDRSYVLRMNSGTLQWYMSSTGSAATLMLDHAMVVDTMYDVEIKRVGTALSLTVDGVVVDTYTLSSGYTVYVPADTSEKTLVGDYINTNNMLAQVESMSFEFLS